MAKKRSTTKRERINTGTDKRYVKRSAAGRFTESDAVSRSLSVDQRRTATTAVKAGFGDQGDRRTTKRTVKKR